MKITKLPDKYDMNVYTKDKISNKNKICPYCGETKSTLDYLHNGAEFKGIMELPMEMVKEKLFSYKVINYFKYICNSCGAEWESEPYKIDKY